MMLLLDELLDVKQLGCVVPADATGTLFVRLRACHCVCESVCLSICLSVWVVVSDCVFVSLVLCAHACASPTYMRVCLH
jgi:hypothetical protein